ncbi:hypothetical protein [Flavobacterium panacagri]|uniref:hypothetical protein n=1 Tax=Flavobacterium panacagri TaxID=3034146 RepID=UPI0025A61B18|nr:hypothetical protein [Flavobacterium panacagri]
MGIKAANNIFPHDPDDNWRLKLDKGGYEGSALDLFNLINTVVAPDAIIVKGEIVKTLNELSIEEGAFTCRINQQIVTNSQPYSTTIEPAQEGYHRIDILVFTQNGTIVKIKGSEDLSSAQEPDTPDNTIKISFTSIFGLVIGDPEIPVVGDAYVSKASKSFIRMFQTGDVDTYPVDDRTYLKFETGMLSLKSLNISLSSNIYHGKDFIFKNGTTGNVTLYHNLGSGNFRFNIPNGQNLILKAEESVHFVMRAINSTGNGGILDYVGITPVEIDITGKEDTANKSNFVTDADSSIKFPVWSSITLWIKEKLNAALASKTNPESTDVLIIGDNSDSGKTKKIAFSNFISWIQSFFQAKDNQIEVSASSNVLNAWHGQTVLFTANCTITVPSSLVNALDFSWRTMAGVSVTWAITSPFVWESPPSNTPEKTVGHFMRRGSTNTVILDV